MKTSSLFCKDGEISNVLKRKRTALFLSSVEKKRFVLFKKRRKSFLSFPKSGEHFPFISEWLIKLFHFLKNGKHVCVLSEENRKSLIFSMTRSTLFFSLRNENKIKVILFYHREKGFFFLKESEEHCPFSSHNEKNLTFSSSKIGNPATALRKKILFYKKI